MRMRRVAFGVVGLAMAISAGFGTVDRASAQGTFADKAVKMVEGKWVSDRGRLISFEVKDFAAKFSDEAEPGLTITGGYQAGGGGSDLVLSYPSFPGMPNGFKCNYMVQFPTSSKGNEIVLRLVSSSLSEEGQQSTRLRCFNGVLKRTR